MASARSILGFIFSSRFLLKSYFQYTIKARSINAFFQDFIDSNEKRTYFLISICHIPREKRPMLVIAALTALIVASAKFIFKLIGKADDRDVKSGILIIAGFVALVLVLLFEPLFLGTTDPKKEDAMPQSISREKTYIVNAKEPAP